MAWKVDRHNELRNETVTAAPNYATGVEAFDAAWDNCGTFVKNVIRSTEFGNDENPPAPDNTFKVYVRYRTGKQVGMTLRYDYPTGTPPNNPEGDHNTNEISWTIRFE